MWYAFPFHDLLMGLVDPNREQAAYSVSKWSKEENDLPVPWKPLMNAIKDRSAQIALKHFSHNSFIPKIDPCINFPFLKKKKPNNPLGMAFSIAIRVGRGGGGWRRVGRALCSCKVHIAIAYDRNPMNEHSGRTKKAQQRTENTPWRVGCRH